MKSPLLLYGATEPEHPHFSPDMLWRTGFRAPDPFYCLISYSPSLSRGPRLSASGGSLSRGEQISILVSRLEYGRAKEWQIAHSTNSGQANRKSRIANRARIGKVFLHEGSIVEFLKAQKISSVKVPASFPVGIAEQLKRKVKLEVINEDIFPERAMKTAWEVKEIEKAGRAVGKAIDEVRAILRESRIKGQKVYSRGKVLTSEFLRGVIEQSLFTAGYLASGTIVSSGKDTAYPHAVGSGSIWARIPIVMDIFPRSKATNYYADITRTVFKGEPAEPIKKMYQAVLDAQEQAIKNVHAGVDASDLHKGVVKLFDERGYKTIVDKNITEGFIHGLGHGVGIEIHEAPRVGGASHILQAGNIITIEPGLYYPNGFCHSREGGNPVIAPSGVRIEDMLLVTKTGHKLLSPISKGFKWAVIS